MKTLTKKKEEKVCIRKEEKMYTKKEEKINLNTVLNDSVIKLC